MEKKCSERDLVTHFHVKISFFIFFLSCLSLGMMEMKKRSKNMLNEHRIKSSNLWIYFFKNRLFAFTNMKVIDESDTLDISGLKLWIDFCLQVVLNLLNVDSKRKLFSETQKIQEKYSKYQNIRLEQNKQIDI